MKKLFSGIVILTSLLLGACGGKTEEKAAPAPTPEKPAATAEAATKKGVKDLKIGIALSTGGLGDKSFNDSAYRGLEKSKAELGVNFKYVEPASPAEDEQFLREYADAGYDLVIATGFQMKTAAEKVAKEYPKVKFAMIDDVIELPNVKNLTFKEDEGSFLAGAAAAMVSKTGTVGFVGGIEVPLIQKFQKGFEAGAKYVNPNIKVISIYVGGQNPFNDPVKGKEIALSEVKQGADVIYQAAGATGIGVIDAAKEAKIFAIGVDSDQDDVAVGTVLTSMLKNIDVAVFETVKSIVEDNFKSGTHAYGIKENGVGLTEFKNTKDVIGAENLKKLDEIKAKFDSGELSIK